MQLTKWEPFGLSSFRREMDRLFDSFFARDSSNGDWLPALDVEETPEEVIVKMELPGIDEKNVSVSLSGNNLIVKGERKREEEKKEKHYHRVERSYGSFERVIPITTSTDASKIIAEFKKGVLEVHLPKKPEDMPKEIEVKSQ